MVHLTFHNHFIVNDFVERFSGIPDFAQDSLHSLKGKTTAIDLQKVLYKGNRSSGFKQFHLFFSSNVAIVSHGGAPGIGTDLRAAFDIG